MRHQRLKSIIEKRRKERESGSSPLAEIPGRKQSTKKVIYCFSLAADHDGLGRVEVGHIWKGFKEKTTAHGVPHVEQAKGGWPTQAHALLSL